MDFNLYTNGMHENSFEIGVVVPCFNNQDSINQTAYELIRVLDSISIRGYKILLIDDGSQDQTWDHISNLAQSNSKIHAIKMARNFGQISAIQCGIENVDSNYTIIISADLQDPPDLIIQMYSTLKKGHDVVICYRSSREDKHFERLILNLFYRYIRKKVPDFPVGGFDYFAMTRDVVGRVTRSYGSSNFLQASVLMAAKNKSFIPYKRLKRIHGNSGWSFKKKLEYALDILTYVSFSPLRFFSLIGMLFTFFGAIWAAYTVYLWSQHQSPFSGFATIVILILISSGISLVMLGWLGEYVIRILKELNPKPQFLVEREIP